MLDETQPGNRFRRIARPFRLTTTPVVEPKASGDPRVFPVADVDVGLRLDHFLAAQLHDVSRARVQQLIQSGPSVRSAAQAGKSAP